MDSAPFEIETEDGHRLVARLFVPPVDPIAVVVVNGGVALSQRLYFPLARFLATQGFAVLTYDYRGIGESRPVQLRGFRASFPEWTMDCTAALTAAQDHIPDRPLILLGHSFGGVLGGLTPKNTDLDAAVSIATNLSYYKDWADGKRWAIYVQWHMMVPLITRLVGYFPGRRLRVSEDLPASFVQDWHARRKFEDWRTQLVGLGLRAYPEGLRCPVLAIAASDDPICTERAFDRAHRDLINAKIETLIIHPADVGLERIGHRGYFSASKGPMLWPDLAARMQRMLAS